MCTGQTTRQRSRLTVLPCFAALSSQIAQLCASALKPSGLEAATESMPMPCLPAASAPVGEMAEATDISMVGAWYGRMCRRASRSVNQSVCMVTVSPCSSRTSASSDSCIRRRRSAGSTPIM